MGLQCESDRSRQRHSRLRPAHAGLRRRGSCDQHVVVGWARSHLSRRLRCTRPARLRSRCSPNAWRLNWSRRESRLRASVFYPSAACLRTGLWTSERTRPAELARERPRETEAMTPERLEEMADGGARAALAAARRAGRAGRRGDQGEPVRHDEGCRRRRRDLAVSVGCLRRVCAPDAHGSSRMMAEPIDHERTDHV